MRTIRKWAVCCAVLICIAAAFCSFIACAEDAAGFEPFIRIDRDSADAYDRDLENLRIITGDMYEFHALDIKFGIPSDYVPDETGLDTLDVSASALLSGYVR